MKSVYERQAAAHDRKLKKARIGAKRYEWAVQDAKRSDYRQTARRSWLTDSRKTDLTTIGLITLVVVILVLAATN